MAQFLKLNNNGDMVPDYLEPYSTTEQAVGHWVNDARSLIYRRTYRRTDFSTQYDFGISNLGGLVSFYGIINRKDYSNMFCPIPSRLTHTTLYVDFKSVSINSGGITLEMLWGSGWNSSLFNIAYFTFEYYYKTTS